MNRFAALAGPAAMWTQLAVSVAVGGGRAAEGLSRGINLTQNS